MRTHRLPMTRSFMTLHTRWWGDRERLYHIADKTHKYELSCIAVMVSFRVHLKEHIGFNIFFKTQCGVLLHGNRRALLVCQNEPSR